MAKVTQLKAPIYITVGDTFEQVFYWKDENGVDIVVTGMTCRSQVRKSAEDTQVIHEWSTANGRATMTDGQITLRTEHTDTKNIVPGVYVFDLSWRSLDGHD